MTSFSLTVSIRSSPEPRQSRASDAIIKTVLCFGPLEERRGEQQAAPP